MISDKSHNFYKKSILLPVQQDTVPIFIKALALKYISLSYVIFIIKSAPSGVAIKMAPANSKNPAKKAIYFIVLENRLAKLKYIKTAPKIRERIITQKPKNITSL